MLTRVRTLKSPRSALLFLAMIAGCADGADKSSNSDDEGSNKSDEADLQVDDALLRTQLGAPLSECEGLREVCAPARDAGAFGRPSQECQSEVQGCFKAVLDETVRVFTALHQCQQTGAKCLRGADRGDRETCKDEFQSCTRAVFGGGGDGGVVARDGGVRGGGRPGRDRDDDTEEGWRRPSLDAGIRKPLPGQRDSGVLPGRPERPERPEKPEIEKPTKPTFPGRDRPLPVLDAGTQTPVEPPTEDETDATESGDDTTGIASPDCLERLIECGKKNAANPTVCAEEAQACLQ